RHTRSKRDWSSDVCSSDLLAARRVLDDGGRLALIPRFRLRLTHPLGLGSGGPLLGGELLDSALSPHGVPAVTLGFGLLSAALGLDRQSDPQGTRTHRREAR